MSGGATADGALRLAAEAWRDDDPDPATRAEVDALLAAGDLDGLRDRFAERLQFGTAGLRGPLGAGPNRMNRALVRRATAGVAAWLSDTGRTGAVVVGRDARHGSAEFAEDTAAVLAGAGFEVLVLPRPLPTPVAAFAVLHHRAAAGIVITASHNPPQDNGYKLYLGDGAQIVPPVDGEISARIDAVGSLLDVPLGERGIRLLDDTTLDAYLAAVSGLLTAGGRREVTAVYTAMHGVGAGTVRRAFAAAGFPDLHEVGEQVEPDPEFPTVAFPNPEEPGALDLALARARDVGADLVLANDPDADRLAVAIPDPAVEGGWRALTGDELGALLADHLLRRGGHQPDDTLVTTVVSSRLLSKLAAAHGVAYAEALTGFKWVVRAPAPGHRFLFGYEEALGYCVGEVVRDKDGISAALVVAELAAERRAAGSSLRERLEDIFRTHGAHVTRQRSIRIAGADWLDRVTAAMAVLRSDPPTAVGGLAVRRVEDLLPGERFAPSDVLIYTLDGARLVVRPSGTEPKCKCYAEAVVPVGPDGDVAAARTRAAAVVEQVLDGAAAELAARGL
ncbi:MAG TPA: phospho-sugar mutase [Acidimicrobiales bacterium]|nr:phospho-sugar mutase [Acidimicrobiales bacterium]